MTRPRELNARPPARLDRGDAGGPLLGTYLAYAIYHPPRTRYQRTPEQEGLAGEAPRILPGRGDRALRWWMFRAPPTGSSWLPRPRAEQAGEPAARPVTERRRLHGRSGPVLTIPPLFHHFVGTGALPVPKVPGPARPGPAPPP